MFKANSLPCRLLPLALTISIGLLTGCGGPPTPTTPPVTVTPALPAPTLTLGATATTVATTGSTSISLQVNRTPDSVTVGGQPSGLTATFDSGVLKISAQNVLPGTYPLKVTGMWGNDSRSANLQLTVQGPVSTPVAPEFTLSLSVPSVTLATGQTGSASVSVQGNSAYTGGAALSAKSSSAALTVGISGQTLSLNAASATPGEYTVTITGRMGSVEHSVTLPVTVTAQPTQVTGLTVAASSSSVNIGGSVVLRATVQGSGNFNTGVTWQSSGGQLVANADGSATLNVAANETSGIINVTATSIQDPARTASTSVTVKATPQTVTLAQSSLSLSTSATGTIAYSGPLQSAALATTSNLISGVSMQGGNLQFTAGQTAGTGTVRLILTLQDGSTQSALVQVTVTAPTTNQGGYGWYAGTDRPASADELEVLRLTNEVRAKGATCGTTAYAPAPALTWNDQLAHAARNHATDMGTRGYFNHTTPEGVVFSDRISAAGFNWSTVAENIAAGYNTPKSVVDGWVASAGHCVNLMNPNLKELGVGGVNVAGSPYGNYWVQDFGSKR